LVTPENDDNAGNVASKSSQGRISYSPAPNGIGTHRHHIVSAQRNHNTRTVSQNNARRHDNNVPHDEAQRDDNVGRGVAVAAIDEARFFLALLVID
jgi:hypothetical protein